MKRCIKWLIKWFTQWTGKMTKEEKIGYAIGALMGVIVSIILFIPIDKVPATASDFEVLENQIIAIQHKPDLLFTTNCNINVNDKVITVKLENDECEITTKYNQEFEILSSYKKDKYTFWLFALLLAIVGGFFSYGIGSICITVIIYVVEILWKFICDKFRTNKLKSQKA